MSTIDIETNNLKGVLNALSKASLNIITKDSTYIKSVCNKLVDKTSLCPYSSHNSSNMKIYLMYILLFLVSMTDCMVTYITQESNIITTVIVIVSWIILFSYAIAIRIWHKHLEKLAEQDILINSIDKMLYTLRRFGNSTKNKETIKLMINMFAITLLICTYVIEAFLQSVDILTVRIFIGTLVICIVFGITNQIVKSKLLSQTIGINLILLNYIQTAVDDEYQIEFIEKYKLNDYMNI